jgi:hypothetical protein
MDYTYEERDFQSTLMMMKMHNVVEKHISISTASVRSRGGSLVVLDKSINKAHKCCLCGVGIKLANFCNTPPRHPRFTKIS